MPPHQSAQVQQVLANLKQITQGALDSTRAQRDQADGFIDTLMGQILDLTATVIQQDAIINQPAATINYVVSPLNFQLALQAQTLNAPMQSAQPTANTVPQAPEGVPGVTTETVNAAPQPTTTASTSTSPPANHLPNNNNTIATGVSTAAGATNFTTASRGHKRNISIPTGVTGGNHAQQSPAVFNATGSNDLTPPGAGHRRLQSVATSRNIVPNQPVLPINGLPAIVSAENFATPQPTIAATITTPAQPTIATATTASTQPSVGTTTVPAAQPAQATFDAIVTSTGPPAPGYADLQSVNDWVDGASASVSSNDDDEVTLVDFDDSSTLSLTSWTDTDDGQSDAESL